MGPRIRVCLQLLFIQIFSTAAVAETHIQDAVVLTSLKDIWENTPPNWVGFDPCGDGWDGIRCTNSRVTSIILSSIGLMGQLSGDLMSLSELQILDLSYNKGLTGSLPTSIGSLEELTTLILVGCSFFGPIPESIGSLKLLNFLALNSNSFIGKIPPTIGNLSNLYWLDLTDNQLTGTIPVSNEAAPGLDMLLQARHFHLGNNKLSGKIPTQLFSSNMALIQVLFDGNRLTDSIPSTLGLVQTLEVIRLDKNSLSGPVPLNLNNLTNVSELFLSNNTLTGPVPNLTGMNHLHSVTMEKTQLQGQVPEGLFSLPNLQTVVLRNNLLNGTLKIGSSYSNQLKLIDLQNNYITDFTKSERSINIKLLFKGNPICLESEATEEYCEVSQSNPSYSTKPKNCEPVPCSWDQISSPNCKCAYPYSRNLVFISLSFLDLENSTHYTSLEQSLMNVSHTHQLPVDSVSLSILAKDSSNYFRLNLEVFPSGQSYFNRTGISRIGFVLSNQTFRPPKPFGAFYFIGDAYANFTDVSTTPNKSSSFGIIIGAVAGCSVLVLLLVFAGVYVFRQKRRAERATEKKNPFASWDPEKSSGGGAPQLEGARWFSFEELKKCTDNFSEANELGSGGYGKVYRGTLSTGQLAAIKRAQQGSTQGGLEFKTEIELLSRVHHKNVVSLVGFCFDQVEQMLVDEYVPNGTLRESLLGKSGIRLDWIRRLKVARGTARGLAYLHELANPPIIHRDIKSNNILLDERLNAKVADFGLSKLIGDNGKDHVTTQVKGTMGYMDPEYYMTQQLTEKSDVYSFGVLLLELITARKPIERGKYIVNEIRTTMDKTKDLYNLYEILDPAIGLGTTLKGLEKFVDLAMRCAKDLGADRPTMGEVVKEIENIMQLAG